VRGAQNQKNKTNKTNLYEPRPEFMGPVGSMFIRPVFLAVLTSVALGADMWAAQHNVMNL